MTEVSDESKTPESKKGARKLNLASVVPTLVSSAISAVGMLVAVAAVYGSLPRDLQKLESLVNLGFDRVRQDLERVEAAVASVKETSAARDENLRGVDRRFDRFEKLFDDCCPVYSDWGKQKQGKK